MHFSTLAAFTCLVMSASAFDYPEFVPLHRRQDPGTPAYECHANCGGVITSSRSDDFCDSSTFKSQLSDCLKCANEFDIWKYYGNSVSKAAESCGLDSTPEDAGNDDGDSASTTVGPAPTTSAGSSVTATEAPTEAATTSTENEETTTAPGTTAPSATQSFTTTASAPRSSHPVIPTGSKSTPVSGSGTPTGQATASASSSDIPLSNSATSAQGNLWVGVVVGSLVAVAMGI
ncbi:uncharacterized protein LDX57_006987 [Aspergillus melleus]|uniref:uncharacterized protein n=1 Tax=Aspergillus melleus TaxID=138277 RepID=UPI001E8CDBDE|nr:uncharacterized protein LDX57_006987 [Aspergillus melleus]KAH8429320.1 hypothetical protein LDX57_006987 [Aspergillus melleus]